MSFPAQAEPVRLLSWNAQSFTRSAETQSSLAARMNSAALWLAEFEPDVVLLQELPDRQVAEQMAARLGPGFSVAVCSSLPGGAEGESAPGQVAVLTRLPSALAWAGGWTTNGGMSIPGGFAFAVLQSGQRWISVQSVLLPSGPEAASQRRAAMRQFLDQAALTLDWTTNRPAAHAVAGTIHSRDEATTAPDDAMDLATGAGFVSVRQGLPAEGRQTVRARELQPGSALDDVWLWHGELVPPARIQWGIASDHACLVVDWDLESIPALDTQAPVEVVERGEAQGKEAPQEAQPGEAIVNIPSAPERDSSPGPGPASPPPPQAPDLDEPRAGLTHSPLGADLRWWLAGGSVGCLVLGMILLRRARARGRSVAAGVSLAKIPEAVEEGVTAEAGGSIPASMRPHLLAWLKQQFIGRLLVQRREMINAQHHASERAEEMGRRVALVEKGLLGRIRQAEQRVRQLERELAQARSDNRELLRMNLTLAQRELREARQRAGLPERGETALSSS